VDGNEPTQYPNFNYAIPPIDLSLIRGIKGSSARKSGNSKNRNPGINPIPILMPWPEYPEGASKDYTGQVKLKLYVNTKGNVEEVILLNGLAPDSFNKKAIQAAKKIRFTPGSINGKTVAMWVQISIEFHHR
jgi:TonB family protein